jgi:hypothetical protein
MTKKRKSKHAQGSTRTHKHEHASNTSDTTSENRPEVTTFEPAHDSQTLHIPGEEFSAMRHTRPWTDEEGTHTVPVTVFGQKPLSPDRRVYLQRSGWRTAIFGWAIGGLLGGTIGKEVDVTPKREGAWDSDVEEKRRQQYDEETLASRRSGQVPADHEELETYMVKVPASHEAGDVRIIVYPTGSTYSPIVSTPSFQLDTAAPASFFIHRMESMLEVVCLVWSVAIWLSFWAVFPALKMAQIMFGAWGTSVMNMAHRLVWGCDAVDGKMGVHEVEPAQRNARGEPGAKQADGRAEDGLWFRRSK